MHEIHGRLDFRPQGDYGITLLSMGQRLMFVFSWAHWDFSLALTVSELRVLFLFPDSKFIYLIV